MRHLLGLIGALAAAAVAACTADTASNAASPARGDDSPITNVAADASPRAESATTAVGDPFAPQPDESEGLHNVSADLDELLENGTMNGACDRYFAGATDRKTMLLCGKWMFFHDPFDTAGMPAAIVKFLANNFETELGLAFEKLGMIPDPASSDHLPLGLAPSAPMQGNVESIAFTCAACHFARMPDGRYAVGAPNHRYDYAAHILGISLVPTLGMGLGKAADHHPAAVAKVQPVLDKLSSSLTLRGKLGVTLLPLASMKRPAFTKQIESDYASWPLGTMDFVIAPLPVDDEVHTVSKIMSLWGIPRPEEASSAGMTGALLATTGDAQSLDEFVRGFAMLGGVAPPSADRMKPLLEFIYSLRAPKNVSPPPASLAQRGAELFATKGCITCHDGPRGSGKRVFTFDEIGTDRALARWADKELDGQPCCQLDIAPGTLKHGVKSPRIAGTWALERFLHNGALTSLEQLFCIEARPGDGAEPNGSQGHTFTCDNLTRDEKEALIGYLRAN